MASHAFSNMKVILRIVFSMVLWREEKNGCLMGTFVNRYKCVFLYLLLSFLLPSPHPSCTFGVHLW